MLLAAQNQFDTHAKNSGQHKLTDALYDDLDLLLSDLEAAGELDRTVVAVISEMTRSPQRNSADGKDHWPAATCCWVRGSRAVG